MSPNPRWRKVLSDLWLNKTRTCLVVLSMTVGIFAVGMIAGTWVILSREVNGSWNAINPSSVRLYIPSFDDDFLDHVLHMQGVGEVQGERRIVTRIQIASGESLPLWLFTYDYDNIRINTLTPERGAWPPPDHEILIERMALGLIKSNPGDTVSVEMPDGKQRQLKIAGTVHDSFWFPAPLYRVVYGYVSPHTFESLGGPDGYSVLNIVVADDKLNKDHAQQVANRVRDKVEKDGYTVEQVIVPTPGENPATPIINAILLVLAVLSVLSLLLSGFLVTNTISALLTQQVKQIGVMKAIGARPYQMMGMYLVLVMGFGLLALLIGLPAGMLGARSLSRFIATVINVDIVSYDITPGVVASQVAIGLIVPFLAAFFPVLSGTRLTVREAISLQGIGSGQLGTGLVDRGVRQISQLLPLRSRPLLLSFRNLFRHKGRLTLTLVALILGSAIFIAVFSVRASVEQTLDEALQAMHYDIEITFRQPYPAARIERAVLSVPGVVMAESWGANAAYRVRPDGSNGDLPVVGLPATTDLFRPVVLQGRWLLPDDQNAMVINTDVLREEKDVGVGDTITLTMQERETAWQIVGIIRGQLQGPLAYANYDHFAYVVRDLRAASSVRVVTEQHSEPSQSRSALNLDTQLKSANLAVLKIATAYELRSTSAGQFNMVVMVLLVMATLLGLVGGIGLMGTLMLNVLERTREIGIIRALGAADGTVMQIFISEGVFIGILSWAVGALLAIPLSQALSNVVGMALVKTPLSYTFSASGTLVWLFSVMILAALASLLPARRAARVSVREALAYE